MTLLMNSSRTPGSRFERHRESGPDEVSDISLYRVDKDSAAESFSPFQSLFPYLPQKTGSAYQVQGFLGQLLFRRKKKPGNRVLHDFHLTPAPEGDGHTAVLHGLGHRHPEMLDLDL